ncbi:MAG: cysteine-rich CWC family protein [Crocinitomicaceae bacterium]
MKKVCEKCQNEFECKADDIKNCHCNTVQLTPQEIVTLGAFKDCLCIDCLKEAKKESID